MTSATWTASGNYRADLINFEVLTILPGVTATPLSGVSTLIKVVGDNITITNSGLASFQNASLIGPLIYGESRFLSLTNNLRIVANGTAIDLPAPGSGLDTKYPSLLNSHATINNKMYSEITAGGTVPGIGDSQAIRIWSGGNTINNDGHIRSYAGTAIVFGSIRSLLGTDAPNVIHNNPGAVIEDASLFSTRIAITTSDDSDIVDNAGTITGIVSLGGGNDQFTNYGTATGDILTGNDSDTVRLNGGMITGSVDLGDGNDVFTGSAGILTAHLLGGGGNDEVTVSGATIKGNVDLGAGNDTFDGRGGTLTGSLIGGGGDDIYILDSLTGFTISELAGGGNDELRIGSSATLGGGLEILTLLGSLDLSGTGNALNNTLNGNAGANILSGAEGADRLFGGGGNDTLNGGMGRDRLFGGDGDDQFDGGVKSDTLFGDSGNDVLRGGDGDDRLFGGSQNDILYGGRGGDQMSGGGGNDILNSGPGADMVSGGNGNDVFVFNSWQENATSFVADTITDFTQGDDIIDLQKIVAGKLTFIASGDFTATAPEVLGFLDGTGRTVVIVDVNGDGTENMGIFLNGEYALTAADFLL